ncbi:MAG: hypothetical protein KJO91_05090, partial [Gammaproteobacteria bacterium]|nr:hypothetical protein [Gammaproteobacteria bacterium]
MIRTLTRRLLIFFLFLTLASCAIVQEQTTAEPETSKAQAVWAAEQKKRAQVKIWEVRGRLGVQTETNGGSMDIIWKQSDEDFSIRLL